MIPLTVAEFIQATRGLLVLGDPRAVIGGRENKAEASSGKTTASISTDSRTLKFGDVFFALKGERYDGHNFVNEALQKGAQLCIVSKVPEQLQLVPGASPAILKVAETKKALQDSARYYRNKVGEKIKIVGIAGSCGKTTVKEMLAQMLCRWHPTVYSPENFNNEIGCPRSLFAIEQNHRFGVFEIGASSSLEVQTLSAIVKPEVAILTNIYLEHTATFGTLQQIAEGESQILLSLAQGGTAVLPADDAFYTFLKSRIPKEREIEMLSFGTSPAASVYPDGITENLEPSRNNFSTSFNLIFRKNNGEKKVQFPVTIPTLGKFNVLNAVCAATAALALHVPQEIVQEGLAHFRYPKMRFQITIQTGNILFVNDAYNANPGSMKVALESFVQSFPDWEKIVVLGDMLELGEISRQEHYALGQFLAKLPLSRVLLYGAQAKFIFDGLKDSFANEKTMVHCKSKDELVQAVKVAMKPGTAILFKASRGIGLEEVVHQCSTI